MPAVPEIGMALVDVRDVARAHVMAMTDKKVCASCVQCVYVRSQLAVSQQQLSLCWRVCVCVTTGTWRALLGSGNQHDPD